MSIPGGNVLGVLFLRPGETRLQLDERDSYQSAARALEWSIHK